MRQFLLSILFLFLAAEGFPQVLINEFSSSNISKLADEDGSYEDWLELYNASSQDIDLQGYHLSDKAANLKKWTFPSLSLMPGSHLLVFASGKNRTLVPLRYRTIISRGDNWEYIVPLAEPGDEWKNTGYDASAWSTGKSGFGYGDGDDSTLLNGIASVFIRKEFTISNLQDIAEMVLSIDYDDGFIAYINGHEIARSNVGPAATIPYNFLTGTLQREATMYQGGYPENFVIQNPQSVLVEGTNVLAIQGHNSDVTSSDLSLIPILSLARMVTDGMDSVPDYIQLKGRNLHTNFKISSDGETLILSRPDSSVVDSVSGIKLLSDVSYGRKPDGSDFWLFFSDPTPGSANNTMGYSSLNGDTVIFSSRGGYYPGGVSLLLTSVYQSDSIFYTIDGSEPTVSSTFYSGPIQVNGNSVIRARSFKYNRLPGAITTNTYVTTRHTLPVVCLSTDPPNLWDYNTGIYVLGPNASPDAPFFGANFWQDWERRAHMELYDTEGIKQIDQDIGIKIFGSYSRALPEKSLALFARKEYGKGAFDYKVFKDKPIDKFESLVLRNGGNDWDQAMARDGLTSTLVRDMDIDRQAFQPTVVYINGEYWGILNMREKVNSNYLAENHFVNPDKVNILEFNGNIVEGDNTSYLALLSYLENNSLQTSQNYKKVSSLIDVNNYIQYQLSEIYINNKDWPGNNMKYWNTSDQGSLWRWIIYDTDFGFSIWEETAYNFNTLAFALEPNGPGWPNPPWATLLFRRMMSNEGFRAQFATQYADRLNRNFTSERVNFAIDSIKNVFYPEIQGHLNRWELSTDTWQNNYGILKTYANYRPEYARMHLRSQLNLGEQLSIKVEIDNPGTGSVKVNSIMPYKYPFYGIYFKDLPIKLTAIPAPGYRFVKWEMGSLVSYSATLDYDMAEARNFNAVFEPARNSDTKIIINEINYNSSPDKDTKDWVELYNAGNSTVNLKNWILSDGSAESGYIFPSDYIFAPGMYIVVCKNAADFRQFWPRVSNVTGDIDFGLSSEGDDVNLYDPDGNLVDFVTYSISTPWPTDANGTGKSIELTDPFSDNNDGKNWKSSPGGGTPGNFNAQSVMNDTTGTDPLKGCRLTCYPNPFSDYTTLHVEITDPGRYKIQIYDIQGRIVNELADQTLETGEYYLDWYGRGYNNSPLQIGVYIIRLSGEKQHFNTRVILMK